MCVVLAVGTLCAVISFSNEITGLSQFHARKRLLLLCLLPEIYFQIPGLFTKTKNI
jgi:threonine/homoserine efflux transporter RhtA